MTCSGVVHGVVELRKPFGPYLQDGDKQKRMPGGQATLRQASLVPSFPNRPTQTRVEVVYRLLVSLLFVEMVQIVTWFPSQ
jgi:hypothetical protein